jgi:hypothetical protein
MQVRIGFYLYAYKYNNTEQRSNDISIYVYLGRHIIICITWINRNFTAGMKKMKKSIVINKIKRIHVIG